MTKRVRDRIVPATLALMDRRSQILDQRTAAAKAITDKENADLDAKTARLRALRLARDAQQSDGNRAMACLRSQLKAKIKVVPAASETRNGDRRTRAN